MAIKCSVFIATSLDGFIARSDGSIDWLMETDTAAGSEDYGYREFYDSVDTLVMGHHTFELVRTFPEWPYAGKRVVVLGSRHPQVPSPPLPAVEVMSGSPAVLVHHLEQTGSHHVYVDGGRTIQGFLSAGLVQDMIITRIPILIGDGIPLFGRLDHDIRLEHVGTKAYKSGVVQGKYRVLVAT